MADPLSISASLLAVVTAAIQSSKALCATVQSYKNRDKSLRRLQQELEDLVTILSSLEAAIGTEAAILRLLQKPIERCNQVCQDFERAMIRFKGKSSLGIIDWARMEFMSSDINGFMDTLAGYKSTISVGVGAITMQNSRLNKEVLEEYSEMIKDTSYNLNIHLQRIDEKLAQIVEDNTPESNTGIDLQDEKDVTEQCLRICEDAKSYIESLQVKQPSLSLGAAPTPASAMKSQFEAQLLTSQALNGTRDKVIETIGHLQERLSSIMLSNDPENDRERARLREDIKECLEVCDQASKQVSRQKIHFIGEVIAEDDTDQVVVTTLADLFDVRKVLAKNRSAQLVGSMDDETLQKLSKDRYSSRFGAPDKAFNLTQEDVDISNPPLKDDNMQLSERTRRGRQTGDSMKSSEKPSSNEIRKRTG